MLIKVFKNIFGQPELRRRLFIRIGLRLGTALALALIWHFTLATPGRQADLILLICTVLLLGWAWVQYLKMDGMYSHGFKVTRIKKGPAPQGSMAEQADTDPRSDITEEERKDRAEISFVANTLSALVCLLGTVAMSLS